MLDSRFRYHRDLPVSTIEVVYEEEDLAGSIYMHSQYVMDTRTLVVVVGSVSGSDTLSSFISLTLAVFFL